MKYLHLTAAAAVLASSTFASFQFEVHGGMEKFYMESEAGKLDTDHATDFKKAADGTALAGVTATNPGPITLGAYTGNADYTNNAAVLPTAANQTAANALGQKVKFTFTPQKADTGILAYGGGNDIVGHKTSTSKFLTSFGVGVGMNVTKGAFVKMNLDLVSGSLDEHIQDKTVTSQILSRMVIDSNRDAATPSRTVYDLTAAAYSTNNKIQMFDFATKTKAQYAIGATVGMKTKGVTLTAGIDLMRFKTTVAGTGREYANSNAAKTATNDLKITTDAVNENITLLKVGLSNAITDRFSVDVTYKFGNSKSATFKWQGNGPAANSAIAGNSEYKDGFKTGKKSIFSSKIGLSYLVF